jgi:hypothetical protein
MISHTPEWVDCACESGQYEDSSLLFELPRGRQVLLPAVRHKIIPEGLIREKSLPHGWGSGGFVTPGGITPDVLPQLIAELSNLSGLRVSIRPNPLQASLWKFAVPEGTKSEHHVTHILSLDGGFDHIWSQQFDSATRTKIRKAEKSGLVIERDSSGKLVPEFYQLYLDWTERRARERHLPIPLAKWLAKMREPYHKFQQVAGLFGEACHLWIARLNEQLVAAAFLLVWGDHAVYWRSASNKELTLQTRANDLLQKVMIEDACQSGCRFYHMGESGGVASLMHFKSRFGGVEHPYEEYFFGHSPLDVFPEKLKSLNQRSESSLFTQNRK